MTGALTQTRESESYEALDSMLKKYIEDTGSVLTASKKVNKFNAGMSRDLGMPPHGRWNSSEVKTLADHFGSGQRSERASTLIL